MSRGPGNFGGSCCRRTRRRRVRRARGIKRNEQNLANKAGRNDPCPCGSRKKFNGSGVQEGRRHPGREGHEGHRAVGRDQRLARHSLPVRSQETRRARRGLPDRARGHEAEAASSHAPLRRKYAHAQWPARLVCVRSRSRQTAGGSPALYPQHTTPKGSFPRAELISAPSHSLVRENDINSAAILGRPVAARLPGGD